MPPADILKNSVSTVALSAISTSYDTNTLVILYWTPVEEAAGYNLYRCGSGQAGTSWTLINQNGPIHPVKTCAELKSIIPQDSPEWGMIQCALGATLHRKDMQQARRDHHSGKIDNAFFSFPNPERFKISEIDNRSPSYLLEQERTDPCKAVERGLNSDEVALLQYMARNNLKIALAMGLAFIDDTVTTNVRYIYELCAILQDGSELKTGASVTIVAGAIQFPDPPIRIEVVPGDNRVLLTWIRNLYAFGYVVDRSLNLNGPFERIHEGIISFDVESDLNGNTLSPPVPGFLDFQRWDNKGLPISHKVNGRDIDGPANNVDYFYRVASCDILGREGAWNLAKPAPLPVTPRDTTPPMAPGDVKISFSEYPLRGIKLTWTRVIRDTLGHQELEKIQTYQIYRAETSYALNDPARLDVYQICSFRADPTDRTNMTLSWTDTDHVIFPPYGEKDFFYRIRCTDASGNCSMPSVIVSGRVPDTSPPGSTHVTGSKGYPDAVEVFWQMNKEPDLAGYQIYRGICNRGELISDKEKKLCNFNLIGQVLLEEAIKLDKLNGQVSFKDTSVPLDSPVCYAYWVRAFDETGNLYQGDKNGCPSKGEYACGRLTERSPPPIPIVTGLRASHRSVNISWAASPIQDLKAFHIYRSEKENDIGKLVGCVLKDGTVLSGPWTGVKPACKDIPAEPDTQAVVGSFFDLNLEPNRIYWYRVSALDWLGNESKGKDLLEIPAVSTFTYTRDLPPTPVISQQVTSNIDCGLTIRWDPPRDEKVIDGFLVFRSPSKKGPFFQVSQVLSKNEFTDLSAPRQGETWYIVQSMDPIGLLSEPSLPVLCRYSSLPSTRKQPKSEKHEVNSHVNERI